ncbi:MAG: hypothetical protein II952_06765 [Paludibacteraceae bacterium]|nr:hypothetical protein [Paludibacteraceae bacterium]
MKKLLSLLCALALVFGVNAAPKKDIRASKFTAVHASGLNHRTDKAKALKTVNLAKEAVPSSLRNAKSAQPAKLARAKKEATVVTIGSWERGNDWGTDGEYYFYSEDNTIAFMFDIFYPEGESDIALGVTYTEADMDAAYCAVFYDGEWHQGLVTASLTKTLNENELPHFEGAAKDSLGAEFSFVFDEEPFVPTGEVVAVKIENTARLEYSAYYQDWVVRAADKNFEIRLDIYSSNADSPVGEYSSETGDFDLGYTWIDVLDENGDALEFGAHDASATIIERNDSLIITGSIIALNGVQYDFDLFFKAPEKQAEVKVEATDLVVDDAYLDWFGVLLAGASNDDYVVYFSFSPESEDYYGTYTIGTDCSGEITIVAQDSALVEFYSGEVTLAKTEEGKTLTGKVLAYNNVEYELDLTYVKPEATRQVTIATQNAELTQYESAWQLLALTADEQTYLSVAAYAAEIAGDYKDDDLEAYYTYVGTFVNGDTTWFDFVGADIHVVLNDAVATVTGSLLAQNVNDHNDVVEFILDIKAPVAQPVDETYKYEEDSDFEHVFASYEVDDSELQEWGSLYVQGLDGDFYVLLDVTLPEGAQELLAGEYNIDDTYGFQTVHSGLYNADYGRIVPSLAATLVEENGQLYYDKIWWIVEGTVTVDSNKNITVDALNSLGHSIKINLLAGGQGIDNAEANAPATKRLVNGQLLIEKNGNRYNALGSLIK